MAFLIYHMLSSSTLVTLGTYHLTCTTINHMISNSSFDFISKPYHPLPSSNPIIKHIPIITLILSLLISFTHQTLISTEPDLLFKGHTPVHHFTSLQSAAVTFLFLTLAISVAISHMTHLLSLPSDVIFGIASVAFYLQHWSSSVFASGQTSDLEAKCDSISSRISALSSLLCLAIACRPNLFAASMALGASVTLQGLWVFQTGLSLYVESFIPGGCHRLLEGSTKCDLEVSRMRAVAIIDLAFVVHVIFTFVLVLVTYAVVSRVFGFRRYSSYEALPAMSGHGDENHIQMRALNEM